MVSGSFRAALVAGVFLLGQALPAPAAGPCCTASPRLRACVYPVADLVVPVGAASASNSAAPSEQLIHTIVSTVSPQSWAGKSGQATIEYHPLTLSLVVNQTLDVHEQIQDLLASLRRQMDVEVAVEMRIVHVSGETVEALGLDRPEGASLPAVATLNDAQVRLLLEKVQQDPRGSVLQAPKLTTFNGQRATIDLTDRQAFVAGVDVVPVDGRQSVRPRVKTVSSGFKVSALPTVSADRRFVKLQLSLAMGSVDSPVATCGAAVGALAGGPTVPQPRARSLQLEKTVVVPDGATALLSGWTARREMRSEPTPVLGKVPYLGRLFSNCAFGPVRQHMLVLVTPRLVVREEEESRIAANDPPTGTLAGEAESEPDSPTLEGPTISAKEEKKEKKEKPVPPPAVPTLYVRDYKFQLTYDLDNVGTSQVKNIEVWWTRDGKSWDRFADALAPTGKALICVKEEGTYGFKLNARSGAGLAGPAPKTGDLPHTWVVVDTTPPTVKVPPVEVSNRNGGEVVLRWSVADEHLAARPVTVRYAEKPAGPWKELVVRGAAEDSHRCPLANLPAICYFRIEAIDKAGNVGTACTTEPVKLDLKVPVIRNVTVKPTR